MHRNFKAVLRILVISGFHAHDARETAEHEVDCPACGGMVMSLTVQERAMRLVRALEDAGKKVRKVIIRGRDIEVELDTGPVGDDYDLVEYRR
jgi:hypothetical protein